MKNAYLLILCAVIILMSESCKKNTAEPLIIITSFSPTMGATGNIVQITGSGFANYSASSPKIFFNGVPAVINYGDDTVINTTVPPNVSTGKISYTVNGREGFSTSEFTILPGKWIQKKDPPFPPRSGAFGFSIGNKGYVGGGFTSNDSNLTDWWQYDPTLDQWTSRTDIPFSGGFIDGVAFGINDKGYLGIGRTSSGPANEFWQYDITANSWTRKGDFPGITRLGAIGLSIGNKAYMGFGENCDDPLDVNSCSYLADWWEYDPATDHWTQKSDFPGPPETYPTGVVINNKIYLGLGSDGRGNNNNWWEYDPTNDLWTLKAKYPGQFDSQPSSFTIANKGYVNGPFESWSYDPGLNLWTQQAFFLQKRYYGVAFSIAGKGYFTTGNLQNDLWEFTPSN